MVFVSSILSAALAASALVELTAAHPHYHPGSPEAIKRSIFQRNARRSLAGCQDELSRRGGVYEKAKVRREQFARDARGARGVPYKRDLDTVLNTDHHSNLTGVTNNTDASTLFTGNSSCVLGPETTEGPYYVDGEYVRFDLRDGQEGVDTYVEVQLIDVNTCEPVPDVYVDFWHANATGVYSGVTAGGNGNSDDETNLDSTFCRGLQQTDSDGVIQFLSIFPGHYTGRAIHIHLAAHQNGTFFSNGTFVSSNVSHVGQVFFDQDLIDTVEATSPYNTNTQNLTTNSDDGILAEEAADIDPFLEYVLLGDDVSEGIFSWVALGIDTTSSYAISAASTLTEDGGVANENSGMGGMGGPPDGSSMPVPSGSAVPSASA
ncbi:hypothetical protein VKT23_013691 [Stygiomarasmius scandens]|uniref:Intradiol ring-cleavage dioxygenases domain-containing protein n=1 Tax=Marasmiellus scandens TaxID=2682957 RepID=A0ABR1J3H9_9AGAR